MPLVLLSVWVGKNLVSALRNLDILKKKKKRKNKYEIRGNEGLINNKGE